MRKNKNADCIYINLNNSLRLSGSDAADVWQGPHPVAVAVRSYYFLFHTQAFELFSLRIQQQKQHCYY